MVLKVMLDGVDEALHGLYKKDGEKFMGIGILNGLSPGQ